ncbi:class I SAM-dependent methyltransferase [Marinobacter confluentis]|uniref:Class I SAM-dependent methyltransferase n=1 Tax=Marinobacter confluentis TaxID=1697557 RepID=A0A4Z1BT98_9GAMM|nr:methyltransferase [Marinobacter confluentis]TGN41275.1 class I SAM-dependent methyltransferase [Marinobacter confluentis]
MPEQMFRMKGVELALTRPGLHGGELRGWDSADELLLEHATECLSARPGQRLLVLDDQFGALTLGLGQWSPVTLADSATLAEALTLNHKHANPPTGPSEPLSWLAPPDTGFDLVVMRIPRQLDYLAWMLRWVNQVLDPAGQILAGGMIKHLPDQSAKVFDQLVVTRAVSRARKKARVITAGPGTETLQGWEGQWQGYSLAETGLQVEGLPAVFSRRRLDIGTRELLPLVQQEVVHLPPAARVVDLACGNGVLGLAALAARPDIEVTFSDVSSQALLSARHNVQRAFPGARADFVHGDGLSPEADGFDLILLNPPFHEGGVVGDHIALALFRQSSAALAPGGQLLMVGNRHLGYHRTLKQHFGRVRQLAASPKFVVFGAGDQEAGRS